jgi:hypothetical protein
MERLIQLAVENNVSARHFSFLVWQLLRRGGKEAPRTGNDMTPKLTHLLGLFEEIGLQGDAHSETRDREEELTGSWRCLLALPCCLDPANLP